MVVAYTTALDSVFNARAVYLQVGMTLGSFMTANVFFHIIPNQKKIMKALQEGEEHSLNVGKAAKFRSLANHYITYPVIFMMLSAHFPILYGSEQNVLILALIIAALIIVKLMMNQRNSFKPWPAVLIGTFVATTASIAAILSIPQPSASQLSPAAEGGKAVFSQLGCVACHQGANISIAPNLSGLFGKTRELADNTEVLVDEAYLRESILAPNAKIAKGYASAMPIYGPIVNEAQVSQLIAYIKEY